MRLPCFGCSTISPDRKGRHLLIGMITFLLACPARAQLATPNDLGVTFSHVHLCVTDTELHKTLWTELFDAALVEMEGFVVVRIPGAQIFLAEKEPTAPSPGTVMDHFGIKVRNVEAILAAWRAMGYKVDAKGSGAQDFSEVSIMMPDGIKLVLEEDPALAVKAAMGHVHFFTPQYRALPAWYADLFEATPQPREDAEMTAQLPGTALHFSISAAERLPTEETAIDHIGFEVDDLDAFVERLKGKGVTLELGPRYIERLDLWIAFFKDPSGVLVEVSEGLDRY